MVHDLSHERMHRVVRRGREAFPDVRFEAVSNWHSLSTAAPLVSIATTAMTPYLKAMSDDDPADLARNPQ